MLTKRPLALPNNASVLRCPPKLQNRVFNGIMVLIKKTRVYYIVNYNYISYNYSGGILLT